MREPATPGEFAQSSTTITVHIRTVVCVDRLPLLPEAPMLLSLLALIPQALAEGGYSGESGCDCSGDMSWCCFATLFVMGLIVCIARSGRHPLEA